MGRVHDSCAVYYYDFSLQKTPFMPKRAAVNALYSVCKQKELGQLVLLELLNAHNRVNGDLSHLSFFYSL